MKSGSNKSTSAKAAVIFFTMSVVTNANAIALPEAPSCTDHILPCKAALLNQLGQTKPPMGDVIQKDNEMIIASAESEYDRAIMLLKKPKKK